MNLPSRIGRDRKYAAAYAAHYSERDFGKALRLYEQVIAADPNVPEAGYSRTQIQNIVHTVVPERTLLDAQIALVLANLESWMSADLGPIPAASIPSEVSE